MTDRLAEIEARRDEGVEILLELTNWLIARVRELEAENTHKERLRHAGMSVITKALTQARIDNTIIEAALEIYPDLENAPIIAEALAERRRL